jgi:hypothetical protein
MNEPARTCQAGSNLRTRADDGRIEEGRARCVDVRCKFANPARG